MLQVIEIIQRPEQAFLDHGADIRTGPEVQGLCNINGKPGQLINGFVALKFELGNVQGVPLGMIPDALGLVDLQGYLLSPPLSGINNAATTFAKLFPNKDLAYLVWKALVNSRRHLCALQYTNDSGTHDNQGRPFPAQVLQFDQNSEIPW